MEVKVEILKTQIKLSKDLYQKPPYQNKGMKDRIENMEAILEVIMSDKITSETGSYKGSPTFTIKKEYQDKDGNAKSSRMLTFGLTKAKAILELADEIKKFVEDNESSNTQQIDLDKLTPEQQQLVQSFIKK